MIISLLSLGHCSVPSFLTSIQLLYSVECKLTCKNLNDLTISEILLLRVAILFVLIILPYGTLAQSARMTS